MSIRLDEILKQQPETRDVEPSTGTRPPVRGIRLGDVASLPRERNITAFNDGLLDITEEKRREWESRGPIGFVEQLRRQDKTEMLPFNPEGAIKSVRLLRAVNRIRDEATPADQRARDEALVGNYLERLEEERVRGFTVGGKVVRGVAELPAFMVEFLATGGIATAGRAAVRKGVGAAARKVVQSQALKATTRIAGGVTGATFRTAAMPHRLTEAFADRQLNAGLELTEKGIQIAEEAAEAPHVSAMKAFGDVLIENFSEVTGPALSRGAAYLVPRQFKSGLERLFQRLHPNEAVKKLWTKAGYNGFLAEMGEERVGAFLRAITGVEDFGADNQDQALDRIVASIPNGEELLVEALVLAVPGALHMSTSQMVNLIQRRRQESGEPQPELAELDDVQADQIVGMEQQEAAAAGEVTIQPEALLEQAEESLSEEALEFAPEALERLREAGIDTTAAEDSLETIQAAIDEGRAPAEAVRETLANAGVEISPEAAAAIDAVFPSEAETPEPITFDDYFEAQPPEIRDVLVEAESRVLDTPPTKSQFTNKKGAYTAERRKIHDEIVAHPEFNKPEAAVEEGQKPRAVIVIGPPAAGKSTLLRTNYADFMERAVELDNDKIKEALPGFEKTLAGAFQEESVDVEERIFENLVIRQMNFAWAKVGTNTENLRSMIRSLKESNYEIELVLMDLSPEQAAGRAIERFGRGGRYVSPRYILERVGLNPVQTYNKLKGEVDDYARYKADTAAGEVARLVEEKAAGRPGGVRGRGGAPSAEAGDEAPAGTPSGEAASEVTPSLGQTSSVGTEGVQLPRSTIREEARRLKAEETPDPTALETFVKDRGGVRPFKKDASGRTPEAEEFRAIPRRFKAAKSSEGHPLDEMAEMAIDAGVLPPGSTAEDLRQELIRLGDARRPPKLSAFEPEAEEIARAIRGGFQRVQPGLKATIREVTGQVKKDEKMIPAMQALRESLRAQAQAAATAARMTRDEIKTAQTELVDLLQKSALDAADKAKFLRTIKNIETQEQLSGALPEIQTRVDSLIEAAAKRRVLAAIRRELKTVKPRRQSGRLVGKFTPLIQEALTRMRRAGRMTVGQAELKLLENLNTHATLVPSPVIAYENMMLNAVIHREEATSKELSDLLETIRELKGEGKEARRLQAIEEQADLEEKRQIALSIVESRPKDRIQTTGDESADDTKWGWYNRATAWLLGWNNIMNRLSWADKKTGTNQSRLSKIASVADEETAEKRGIRLNLKKLRRMWVDAYGEMNDWQLTKRWAEESVEKSLGVFENARGEQVEIKISKAQARKRWMEFQDPTLSDTIFGEEAMAWTDEMRRAVEDTLSPQDLQFARAQMDFYRSYYQGFNAIYSDINGVNLPQNPSYSPIRREVVTAQVLENELLGEIAHRRSITPGAAKTRVANLRALQQLNDIEIIQRHIVQVEHYKAWARKIRVLNGIFRDENVRKVIQANFGKALMRVIDRTIDDFTRGGIDRSNDSAFLNIVKNNYTVAVLSGKFAITVKQLVSFPAFADAIPAKEFIRGLADLGTDTDRKLKILASSEVMRARGLSITPEMREATESREYKAFQLNPNLRNLLLTMTRWGDKGAIFLGGWPVYRYHREVLKQPHSKALKAFEDALSATQQSADLSQTSLFQRGNSWQRLFAVFMSAPNQYFRRELAATEDMFAGRISKQEWAKIMFIYHFLLPMMFQFAADGLEFRIKEQVRAGLLGSLNGIFILGQVLENLVRKALGLKTWDSNTIIDSVIREAMSLGGKADKFIEDLDAESLFELLKQGVEVGGQLTGLPGPQAVNIVEGFNQMADADSGEEWRKGFLRVAGWSEFVLSQGQKKKKGPF